MRKFILILLILSFVSPVLIPILDGSTLYTVSNNANIDANTMAVNWQQKMVKGFNDTYYAVYTGAGEIYITRSFDNGLTWTDWDTLSPASTTNDWYSTIAIDYKQNLHVAWSGLNGGQQYVQYRKFDVATQTWDAVINLTRVGYNADTPSIVVDGDDNIYVFCNINSATMTNRRIGMTVSADNGATWTGTSNVSTDNAHTQGNPFPAVDGDNNVYVTWSGKHVGSNANNQIRFRRYYSSNTTWNTKTLNITTVAGQAQVAAVLSVNKSGTVHIAWDGYNGGANYQIRYANYIPSTNTLSAIVEVTATAFDHRCPGLSATYDDKLHISTKVTTGGNPRVNYTVSIDNGATWSTPIELSPGTDNYDNPCMLSSTFPHWNASSGTSYQGIKKCVPAYGFQVYYQNRTPAPDVLTLYDDYTSFYYGDLPGPEYIVTLNISNSIGTQPSPTQRKLAVSSNGTLYCVHTQNAVTQNVRISRSLDNGQTWSMIKNISHQSAYDADLCIDSEDTLHVGWADNQLGGIINVKYMNMTSAGVWSGTTEISNHPVAGQNQEDINVFVNSTDTVYFVWYGKWDDYPLVYNIHYKYLYNGVLSTQYNLTDDDTYDQYFMSCEFDSEDTMHLAWIVEGNDTYPAVTNIRYCNITSDNVASDFQWVTADNTYTKSYPCLVIDGDDTKHITWNSVHAGSGGKTEIHYRNYSKSSNWSDTEYLTRARTDQTTPSLTCNTYGNLTCFFAGYHNSSLTDQVLRYVTKPAGGSWSEPVNLTANRHIQNPHVLYHYYPYIEAGGVRIHTNMPKSGFSGFYWNETKRINYYNSSAIYEGIDTVCPAYVLKPPTTTKSTASLKGYIDKTANADCTVGFYLSSTEPINRLDYDYNYSVGSGYTTGDYFWYNTSGLTHSTYYYCRAWIRNGSEFRVSNTTYFLTSPLDPYDAETVNGTYNINVTWTNPSINDGSINAYCRYSASTYPTTRAEGTLGFNITAFEETEQSKAVTGLNVGTEYYFSIWLYEEASGSPTIHSYSDSYETVIGTTTGGQYNISFKYENTTYHQVKWHYANANNHTLIVHYANETEYNYFNGTGYTYEESVGDFDKLSKGYLILNLSQTPMWFEFLWNSTSGDRRCERYIVPANNLKNFTFYVYTDKNIYGESAGYLNNSLVKYTLRFVDDTGTFLPQSGYSIYAYIYTYNATGSRMIIHSEFLNSYDQIFPMLLYKKNYFIGISDGNTVYDQLTMVPAEDSTSGTIIIGAEESSSNYSDLTFEYGFSAGIFFHYRDRNARTDSTDIQIFDYNNYTKESLLYHSSSLLDEFNFTYAGGNDSRYYWFNFTFNSSSPSGTEYYSGVIYPTTVYERHNGTKIDEYLNYTLGSSPFVNVDDSSKYVSWISVAVFSVFVIILTTFSGFNAVVSGLCAGGWLIFTGAMVTGTSIIIPGVGMVVIAFTVLYAWGDKK